MRLGVQVVLKRPTNYATGRCGKPTWNYLTSIQLLCIDLWSSHQGLFQVVYTEIQTELPLLHESSIETLDAEHGELQTHPQWKCFICAKKAAKVRNVHSRFIRFLLGNCQSVLVGRSVRLSLRISVCLLLKCKTKPAFAHSDTLFK